MCKVDTAVRTDRQRSKPRRSGIVTVCVLALVAVILAMVHGHRYYTTPIQIREFAKENHLSVWQWPTELHAMLERNPETESFVLHYPLEKDVAAAIDLSTYQHSDSVPLFMQWDERWGYDTYAGELMGLSGCGPTCLSMVCVYLLDDPQYTPQYVAQYAEANGYSVDGNGSAWTLISEGGEQIGLEVTEIPLVESHIIRNLEAGNPIICVVGPGDFTTTGHFIVLTDYADGKVTVNDPNSVRRSETLWDLPRVMEQMRNLWVCCA